MSDLDEIQGVLPLGSGGTGDALSPVAGAIVYSTDEKDALSFEPHNERLQANLNMMRSVGDKSDVGT